MRKRLRIVVWAILSFNLAACTGESDSSGRGGSTAGANVSSETSKVSGWSYDASSDKMRGTTTQTAELMSSNNVSEQPPYEDGPMSLILRRRDGRLDAMLKFEGQFICSSYNDSVNTIAVKFDNDQIIHYSCGEPSDGSPGILFIRNAKSFLARLKKAKHMVVETQIYQSGIQQLEFDVSGLDFN